MHSSDRTLIVYVPSTLSLAYMARGKPKSRTCVDFHLFHPFSFSPFFSVLRKGKFIKARIGSHKFRARGRKGYTLLLLFFLCNRGDDPVYNPREKWRALSRESSISASFIVRLNWDNFGNIFYGRGLKFIQFSENFRISSSRVKTFGPSWSGPFWINCFRPTLDQKFLQGLRDLTVEKSDEIAFRSYCARS